MFLGKTVLKICSKFTGEHPCRSVISIISIISLWVAASAKGKSIVAICSLTASLQSQKREIQSNVLENIFEAPDHYQTETGVLHQLTETSIVIAAPMKKYFNSKIFSFCWRYEPGFYFYFFLA